MLQPLATKPGCDGYVALLKTRIPKNYSLQRIFMKPEAIFIINNPVKAQST
jgi:hypothetical protein